MDEKVNLPLKQFWRLLVDYLKPQKGQVTLLAVMLHQVEDLQRAAASINRIIELRQVQPTVHDGAGVVFSTGPLAVAFDDVSFHYEDDTETNVLQHLTFSLKPGMVLGLLGRTGSGKSTLTKLLFRFYDPSSGAIHLGSGHFEKDPSGNGDQSGREHHSKYDQGQMFNIRQARQTELRQYIGMVTQEVQLFQATVRQNVTLFDDTMPDERILQVIEEVGLDDWLAGLPHSLDTLLEARGSSL